MNQTARHIIISGKVQGVFFRKYAKQKADELKLTGWVKNTEEGNVELFAQGNENKIEALIQWCHQGSPKAEVESVEVKQANADADLKQFLIER
jgi:acylphosphatase